VPQDKRVRAANYSGGFQFASDAAGGISGAEHDKLLSLRRVREPQGPGQPGG
jgi:hypothetical protein